MFFIFFSFFIRNDDVVCIDVGFRNIKIIEVSKNRKSQITVTKFGFEKTPIGAISNETINQVDSVVRFIQKIISQQKIKAKYAKIVMSGTNIVTRIFFVDKTLGEDLDTTVKKVILHKLPINIKANDYRIDYKILEILYKAEKEYYRVFVMAVPNFVIQSYVKVLEQLKLKPLSIDIPGNSTAKLFNKVSLKNDFQDIFPSKTLNFGKGTCAVIDFGSETTIFNVLQDGVLTFNKVILCGSSDIDNHIAKNLFISIDEAEQLKIIYGLEITSSLSSNEHVSVNYVISTFIAKVLQQITGFIEFYQNRLEGNKISKVFITGGGCQLLGLCQLLCTKLNIPVYPTTSLNLTNLVISENIQKEKYIFMANSLGISL